MILVETVAGAFTFMHRATTPFRSVGQTIIRTYYWATLMTLRASYPERRRPNLGDSAGILLSAGSHFNNITANECMRSGDGYGTSRVSHAVYAHGSLPATRFFIGNENGACVLWCARDVADKAS